MHDDAIRILRCPHCADPFEPVDNSLRCARGHSFDLAKQGYVSLLKGDTRLSADTAGMVAARADFLAAGHYAPLADALAELARDVAGEPADGDFGCVLDIGGGTGYYQARVLTELPGAEGILLDISKYAARRAARAHPRISAVVADAWDVLPFADSCASVVLNVFAPRSPAELRRVLRPDGTLLVVTPRTEHLGELVETLGLLRVDGQKDERLARQFSPSFTAMARRQVRRTMPLNHRALAQLVRMGPNAWHQQGAGELERRLSSLPEPYEVTAAVTLTAYRPRP